jgi:hypothetical protein
MDDYSDDVPRWEQVEMAGCRRIVVVLYALDTNDLKFWLAPGYAPAQWLDSHVFDDCSHVALETALDSEIASINWDLVIFVIGFP